MLIRFFCSVTSRSSSQFSSPSTGLASSFVDCFLLPNTYAEDEILEFSIFACYLIGEELAISAFEISDYLIILSLGITFIRYEEYAEEVLFILLWASCLELNCSVK